MEIVAGVRGADTQLKNMAEILTVNNDLVSEYNSSTNMFLPATIQHQ